MGYSTSQMCESPASHLIKSKRVDYAFTCALRLRRTCRLSAVAYPPSLAGPIFLRRTGVHFGLTRVRCRACLSRTGSIPYGRLEWDRQTRRCCTEDRQAGFDGGQTRLLDRNGPSPLRERDKSLPRWRNAPTRHGPPATRPELRPQPPQLSLGISWIFPFHSHDRYPRDDRTIVARPDIGNEGAR